MGERDDLYARLRDKYSHPSRFPGECHGCPNRFERGDPVVMWGGWFYHRDCLDDMAYLRMASVNDIAPGALEDVSLTIQAWHVDGGPPLEYHRHPDQRAD